MNLWIVWPLILCFMLSKMKLIGDYVSSKNFIMMFLER